MQRVVSRSEIESEHEASHSDSEHDLGKVLEQLDQFEFVHPNLAPDIQNEAVDDEGEVAFRLFAAPASSKAENEGQTPQKIRLNSPAIDNSNAGFLQPERSSSYYFQKELSVAEKENINSSALTGQQITELSQSYRPGSAYDWKVLHLPASNLAKHLQQEIRGSKFPRLLVDDESRGCKRPGKKTRVKARVQREARRLREMDGKAAAEAKEAQEREKRTQRNREKKVKKKMREKAKKAGGGGGDDGE